MTALSCVMDCTHLRFVKDSSGMDKLIVDNELAYCELYLHGAHITEFRPKDQPQELLWLSPNAVFCPTKAIRGGIPLCWPWFGPHPSDNRKPAHGFARVSLWQLSQAKVLDNGTTELRLTLTDNEHTQSLWPFAFTLEYTIKVAKQLEVSLKHINTDGRRVNIGGAIHSYFKLGDIAQAHVKGLAGKTYFDKVSGNEAVEQTGDITIAAEVDRVYLDSQSCCELVDNVLARTIKIAQCGSDSTIVWNPWLDKAQQMADMSDDGYRYMLCVEAGLTTGIELAPGESYVLSQVMGIK